MPKATQLVTIQNNHVNLAYVSHFTWLDGRLVLNEHGDPQPFSFPDPDGTEYVKLCGTLSIPQIHDLQTGKLSYEVYTVNAQRRVFVAPFNDYTNALAFCEAHKWVSNKIAAAKDLGTDGTLRIEIANSK